MKKQSKKIIYLSLCLFAFFLIVEVLNPSLEKPLASPTLGTIEAVAAPKAKSENKNNVPMPTNGPAIENTTLSSVVLLIDGKSTTLRFDNDETLIDAMNRSEGEGMISFGGKEYSGLGFFVDTLNGKKAEKGYSWILYINGKEAQVGASQYKLKEGDLIEWRNEKIY